MKDILLSGGSGKRLWPLSNGSYSKQFLDILVRPDGSKYSMLQNVYYGIKKHDKNADITIAASIEQASIVKEQLNDSVDISIEPYKRDTFPAIALAAYYLKHVKKINENEIVVICPVDCFVDDEYFVTLKKLAEQAYSNSANLYLMGIVPKNPSEKFGYIITESNAVISDVISFKEKPNTNLAKQYISQGALWNCGVFAFKLGYILKKASEILKIKNYSDFLNRYNDLEKISFDYAITEHESKIKVMSFNGLWNDIGTWDSFSDIIRNHSIGNCRISKDSSNVNVINHLDVPILINGLKDLVVVATPNGILVTDKEKSNLIKDGVDYIVSKQKRSNGESFREKSIEELIGIVILNYNTIQGTNESLW